MIHMGGMFGVVSEKSCIDDLFYGTDYHSHLGTQYGGLAVLDGDKELIKVIQDIRNTPFRTKLGPHLDEFNSSQLGIGVISDFDAQPRRVESHLGTYGIATVGVIKNSAELAQEAFRRRSAHFTDTTKGEVNPTELVATLINQEGKFTDGLVYAQEAIKGSCSILLLTQEGIYASRDKLGRTPLIVGRNENGMVVASETCSFPNLDYEVNHFLGPGEIVLLNQEGMDQKEKPRDEMQVCSFLWVYYGYPASEYEARNVEEVRYKCGAALAKLDNLEVDVVAGIPDSGTAHGLGYANARGIPFQRPFVKYTPTWPRSFMPQTQGERDEVARMKLIPIEKLIRGKSILFCEDSIVRGTQLRDTVKRLYQAGAAEVHMRPACPPLIHGCDYLNFSRSRALTDLAGIRAVHDLEGIPEDEEIPSALLNIYSDHTSESHLKMVDWIKNDLGLTSLKYQRLPDLIEAIDMPKDQLCTHCWDGTSYF
jgi:amidophosphoribosyltransferase